jgi:hypothetical protein
LPTTDNAVVMPCPTSLGTLQVFITGAVFYLVLLVWVSNLGTNPVRTQGCTGEEG